MVATVLTALTLAALQGSLPLSDSLPTFADSATRALVMRGIARRREADTAVTHYTAQLKYQLTLAAARSRWGHYAPLAVEEQALKAEWQAPNDLQVDVLGRRGVEREGVGPLSSHFTRPWFVPRTAGDSLRIVSDEVPAVGALHPLAGGAPEWYRYTLVDSLAMTAPGVGRRRLYAVEVTPKGPAPSLVTGRIWLDSATADVARFTFRYVGTELWVNPREDGDSGSARWANSLVNRFVTLDADLEYAIEQGYWMPYRQLLAGTLEIPLLGSAVSFRAVTTFSDYTINTGPPLVFAQADSSVHQSRGKWLGGEFQINRPPDDSLDQYAGWTDTLKLKTSPEDDREVRALRADLAGMAERLPDELTGQRAMGIGFQRLTDVFRYDRVQGVSLGAGYRLRMPVSFTDLYGTLRYGFSDQRITGRLALVRDAPSGRLTIEGYRDIVDVDPFVSAHSFGRSLNALFAAHDEADYLLAEGGAVSYRRSIGSGVDLTVAARGEREESVARAAGSAVNDFLGGTGEFPPNPPIVEGTFGGLNVGVIGFGKVDWRVGAEGLAGAGRSGARVFGSLSRSVGGGRGATLRLHAGAATTPTLPQLAFRLGGQRSVRGFAYGFRQGAAFWSAQFDVTPFGGGVQPVFFVDAGQAGAVDGVFQSKALVGGGVGVTFYSPLFRTSLLRLDLSRPFSPSLDRRWRFDIVLQAPR
ncbi:MAG TPA: hypothetical protein VFL95_04115 [Gemmatimonadales bacterium]|nr:hypothetical protein [Gemmatimonadales bacterium]